MIMATTNHQSKASCSKNNRFGKKTVSINCSSTNRHMNQALTCVSLTEPSYTVALELSKQSQYDDPKPLHYEALL